MDEESMRKVTERIIELGDKKELVTQDTRLDEDVKLLCSIPGIGFSSAVVIAAEMGDTSLFRKPKQLAAYFGLDPG